MDVPRRTRPPEGKRGLDHELRADRVVPRTADRNDDRVCHVARGSNADAINGGGLASWGVGASRFPHGHSDGNHRLVHPPRDLRYPELRAAQGIRRFVAQSAQGSILHSRAPSRHDPRPVHPLDEMVPATTFCSRTCPRSSKAIRSDSRPGQRFSSPPPAWSRSASRFPFMGALLRPDRSQEGHRRCSCGKWRSERSPAMP